MASTGAVSTAVTVPAAVAPELERSASRPTIVVRVLAQDRLAEDGGVREDGQVATAQAGIGDPVVERPGQPARRNAVAASTSSWVTRGNSSRVPPLVGIRVGDVQEQRFLAARTRPDRVLADVALRPLVDRGHVDRCAAGHDGQPDELGAGHRDRLVRPEADARLGAHDGALGDRVGAREVEVLEPDRPVAGSSSTRLPVAGNVSVTLDRDGR